MISSPLGFLGAGNMAEALIRGLVETGTCLPEKIFAADPQAARLDFLARTYRMQTVTDNRALAAACPLLVLAVKPQQAEVVFSGLRGALDSQRHVIFSIAAGLTTAYLERAAGVPLRIVRLMPNTPAKLRAGATAFCLGRNAGETERRLARELFGAVGLVVEVEEKLMNAVTALSGSGPAYVFRLCELMAEAGEELGLPREASERLSVQTLLGAARMLAEGGQSAAALRAAVTSAGGTTEAALQSLEDSRWAELFKAAVQKARDRARALSPDSEAR